MRVWVILLASACHDSVPSPAPVQPPAPVPQVPADAAIAVDTSCAFRGALEEIIAKTEADGTGVLTRISPGRNHSRELKYRAVPAGDGYDLVFTAYGASDYPPILNWHGTDPPREKLVVDKSVIAHLAVARGLTHLYDRDVDLHTNMTYQVRDGYPCALIDGDFLRDHPDEIKPRSAGGP